MDSAKSTNAANRAQRTSQVRQGSRARRPADKSPTLLRLSAVQRLVLGQRLRTRRKEANLSAQQLCADALGLPRSHAPVTRLERGVQGQVRVSVLGRLARALDTTPEALLVPPPGASASVGLDVAHPLDVWHRASTVGCDPGWEVRFDALAQAFALRPAGVQEAVESLMREPGLAFKGPPPELSSAAGIPASAQQLTVAAFEHLEAPAPVVLAALAALTQVPLWWMCRGLEEGDHCPVRTRSRKVAHAVIPGSERASTPLNPGKPRRATAKPTPARQSQRQLALSLSAADEGVSGSGEDTRHDPLGWTPSPHGHAARFVQPRR